MSDRPPLRDYSQSLAVLIGAWDYAFLDPVPAAEHSLRRMADLLAGPWCGWPRDRLAVHSNVPSPGDLPDQIITAFDAVTDVAVFYFVGHGQISPDDQLCLGLARSRPEPSRRAATSLRFGDVRQALLDSKAAVKIVILDCCFAGLATRPSLAGDVLDLTAGTGAYTMAATSAYTTAWYQDEPGLAEPQTYFTKYLANLVEEGIPGLPSRLRVDPLFRKLLGNLAADGCPVPHSRAVDDAREFEFAYNAAPAETHRDPELEHRWLAQRFDDEAARRAEAEARVQALQAEVHERRSELERLQARTRHMEQLAAGQQRQLLEAIDEAERRLDHTTESLFVASGEADALDFTPKERRKSKKRFSVFKRLRQPPAAKITENEPGTGLLGRLLFFTLLDDRQAEFDRLIGQTVGDVQEHEPDTLIYITHTVPTAPMQRILYEVYRDRTAYDTHEQRPYISRFEADRRACLLATNSIPLALQHVQILLPSSTSGLLGDKSGDVPFTVRSQQPTTTGLLGRLQIFTLLRDRQAEFDRLTGQTVRDVQEHEPDTLIYITHTVPTAPMQRILYEVYRDRTAYDTHEQRPYMSKFEADRRACLLATNSIPLAPQHVQILPLSSTSVRLDDNIFPPGMHAQETTAQHSSLIPEALTGDSAILEKDPSSRPEEIFFDVRGSSRTMRVSRYDESEIPVISIFQDGTLTGSFQLPTEDITSLADALTSGPNSRTKNDDRWENTLTDSSLEIQAPSPRLGKVFFDARGDNRSMRVSLVADSRIAVISTWQGSTCTGTFRLSREEIPRLTDALTGTGRSQSMWDGSK